MVLFIVIEEDILSLRFMIDEEREQQSRIPFLLC